MTLTVEAKEFRRAVSFACNAIAAKPLNPMLGGAIIKTNDDGLAISGFDYEVSAVAWASHAGTLNRTLVAGHVLRNIAEQLTGDVSLTLLSTGQLEVKAGRARYVMPTMAFDYYPTLPPAPDVVGLMDAEDWRQIITRATVSASRDHMGSEDAMLTGIWLQAAEGSLTARTTDRYRAHQVTWPWSGDDFDVVVPGRRMADLSKTLDGRVSVLLNDGTIGIADEKGMATVRLLAVDYPQIQTFFTIGDVPRLVVSREELALALRAASVITSDTSVVLDVTPDEVSLSAANDETGHSDIAISVDTQIEQQRLVVNATYLAESLAVLPGSHVEINLALPKLVCRGLDAPEAEPSTAVVATVMTIKRN